MTSKVDFPITGNLEDAQDTARLCLQERGFTVTNSSSDGFTIERGSILSTLFFGSFTRDNIFTVQYVQARVDKRGRPILRLSRNLFDDPANEKFFGTHELAKQFDGSVKAVRSALSEAGQLDSSPHR